ncbi:DUF3140 domain-containing protein [Streptomyces chumphonensis]|uniref:DUF3140 domain-containing protein n=1 Tax=Streptomyces chumphonensis TaxID=1214925 RepID=A0A927F4B1_9ACTN|nr:DUF3140 domain-containing protein [Streptomyces chumphonensis]MBD3934102.1 DUF3140 domain-containing protein [Streptomyces chumphonensis]
MSDISPIERDVLWDEFHRIVNMTSQELSDWLRTEAASERAEDVPDQAGGETGRHVLAILRKRRVDLTDADLAVMRDVIDTVNSRCRADLEPTAGHEDRRFRLMSLGHDPLKPASP